MGSRSSSNTSLDDDDDDDDDVDSAVDNYANTKATSSQYQPATALLLVRSRKVKRKKN